jgi:hypothetical protein
MPASCFSESETGTAVWSLGDCEDRTVSGLVVSSVLIEAIG